MIITQNGRSILKPELVGYSSLIVYLSGNDGGATIKLQYRDEFNEFIDLEDGQLTVGSQDIVSCGHGGIVYLLVEGGNSDLELSVITRGI